MLGWLRRLLRRSAVLMPFLLLSTLNAAAAQMERQGPVHLNTHHAALSLDGRYFMAREARSAANSVSVFDLDQMTRTRIAFERTNLQIEEQAISADGQRAVVTVKLLAEDLSRPTSPFQPTALVVIDLETGATRLISSGERYGPAAFTPDARALIYGRSENLAATSYPVALRLHRMELETGVEVQLSGQAYESIRSIFIPPGEEGVYFRFNRPFTPDGSDLQIRQPDYLRSLPSWDRPVHYHTYWPFANTLTPWPRPVVPVKQSHITSLDQTGAAYGSAPPQADNLARQFSAYTSAVRRPQRPQYRIWRFTPETGMEILDPVPPLGGEWIAGPSFFPEAMRWVGLRRGDRDAPIRLAVVSAENDAEYELGALETRVLRVSVEWPADIDPDRD